MVARIDMVCPANRLAGARNEATALFLLVVGSLALSVVGWSVAIGLVWRSTVWTTNEKLLATCCPPSGMGFVTILFWRAGHGSPPALMWSIAAVLVSASLATGAWLALAVVRRVG